MGGADFFVCASFWKSPPYLRECVEDFFFAGWADFVGLCFAGFDGFAGCDPLDPLEPLEPLGTPDAVICPLWRFTVTESRTATGSSR